MPLTLEQHAFRRQGIGASEIAAVVGLNKWSRPIDVWQAKVGQAPAYAPTPATERGDFLEPALREWYAYRHERQVALCDTLRHPEHPIVLATPDGISTAPGGDGDPLLLEIKSPGRQTQYDWGEDGGDEIPVYYLPQVTWAMAVTKLTRAHVVALVHGELRTYEVGYDPDLFEALLAKAEDFWKRYVLKNTPPLPEGSKQYAEFLARRFSRAAEQSEIVTSVSLDKLAGRLVAAEQRAKDAAYYVEKLRAEIKAIMKTAPRCDTKFGTITWRNNKDTTRVDWRAVALAAGAGGDLIAKHTSVVPGPRVFRATLKSPDKEEAKALDAGSAHREAQGADNG